MKNWVKANPELTGTLMKIAVGLTAVVGITGALASAFSFLLFPIGRTALFLGSLGKTIIGINSKHTCFQCRIIDKSAHMDCCWHRRRHCRNRITC